MNKKLRVYIADDHTLFRKAMVNLLQSFKQVSEVKDAENGKELLTMIKYDANLRDHSSETPRGKDHYPDDARQREIHHAYDGNGGARFSAEEHRAR
jgi:DNA-binding NarL/FixJ family response regulator